MICHTTQYATVCNFHMLIDIVRRCRHFATHCALCNCMVFCLCELLHASCVGYSLQTSCHTLCNCTVFRLCELSYADSVAGCVQRINHTMCNCMFFLPMWTSICFLRWLLLANELPHTVQLYGFSPMWTLICWFSCWLCANDLSHNLWSIIYIRWSNSWIKGSHLNSPELIGTPRW
jgi:hypothetical protein